MPQEIFDFKETTVVVMKWYFWFNNFMSEVKMYPWALNTICAVTVHVCNLNPWKVWPFQKTI